ncbi:helicase-related protein [Polyangium fumosum]|uniref:DEAD/DEAH box helicase n=1 Tax=Polyangium fumosum TaxID=889272 RepID=A0A4U1J3E7_9BACT|nr:helicase-related protein [Polyangium fumosum]TKD01686.1 DEAD/DEAH box helicase [Polyangium fumosum]
MTGLRVLFRRPEEGQTWALLSRRDEFGFEDLDLLRPPGRFWGDGDLSRADRFDPVLQVESRRVHAVPTPAALLVEKPDDSWMAMTRRSLARLLAWFLVVEDPQRRLEAQAIVTLAHQASVVQHILQQPSLRRVLLADEVGLGKTVEAGLLIKQVLAQNPGARVLYLSPARLVRNVRNEFEKLGLSSFRLWIASADRDAKLTDPHIVASIHRACHKGRIDEVLAAPPWDMIVVDECHHLSDWAPGGGSPVAQYKLVEKLAERLSENGRLLLMSGTPHQGHGARFQNLLRLLRTKKEPESQLAGRVIYRTKEDVRDWDDQPLFPSRQVNPVCVVDLGRDHQRWLTEIHRFFEPGRAERGDNSAQRRAAGWRAGQALQWATSSVQAGLGYLVRQAIRANCKPETLPGLEAALAAIRPYRRGSASEPTRELFARIAGEVRQQIEDADVEDIEDLSDETKWRPDLGHLSELLEDGVELLRATGDAKWNRLYEKILEPAGDEKVVLFAQPIETVTAMAAYLERRTGERPALILGGQSEEERAAEVERFCQESGPQYLVSSRAGGEGLNLQVARRLVHLDVPWNPMELEQRIGRVHRFLSRRTILVDTLVVKDSREVDTYDYARQKLRMIATTMGTEDRFEALFGRVMSLVPPEELSDILGQGAVGPLSPDEQARLTTLVTEGYNQWKRFHDRYSQQQKQIRALDPGEATWRDLATFSRAYLGATTAEGFSSLRFLRQDEEVVEAPQKAEVFSIEGTLYACGDHGGMPVTRDDGTKAERFGLNVAAVAKALRAQAFPTALTGAAHVRWPEDEPRPHEGTFGVLVLVRQSVRREQGATAEQGATLHCVVVTGAGDVRTVEPGAKGTLLRALGRGTVRREPEEAPALVAAMQRAEAALFQELRPPNETDLEANIRHAVTPLLAAIVS